MDRKTVAVARPGAAAGAGRRVHVLECVGNAIVGGMERWVERLVAQLPRDRFRISLLCPYEGRFSAAIRALGAEVFCVPMPEDPCWSTVQVVQALVLSSGVDLLHAHLPNAHALAGLVSRLSDVPMLSTIHGRQITMLDLEVHRAVHSHLSVVCRHSYYHALGLGVDMRRLSCEPNGVDTRSFHPGPRPVDGLRARLGLTPDTPLVGFVGRLSPEKGPEQFLRAVSLLQEGLPEATRFVMVGEGPMKLALEAELARLGLGQRVWLVGHWDDMSGLYRELDLLVSTSHSEAMPLALMEAMASGLPVVATRVGGIPEIVQHGISGWLVAARDIEDIAGRVRQMLAQAELRQRMGAAARQDMMERLELRPSLERVAALMQSLARPAREPHRLEEVSVLGRAS
ncbi:glycosyltransferase family 4 protein [Mitsuaria sp. WAJ17]|uniref:glycosyltransferase family 4 protein n=1 Tax=Mitsuaria sp. WAJ17 TaxID=2761452 RepID=UPI0016025228|nr:glycosyltransferase family 4 protein [Mitsuaria sp. WAJ17]MBB2485343.1 glycosyltransferase family 4 protein [Mitsuaria sp. WAJ17]